MTITNNKKLAAWACLLSAILTIPTILLALAGATLEGLIEVRIVTLLSILIEIIITLVSVYIFIVLKNYLHSSRTTWVLWSIIAISILYSVFSLAIIVFPDIETLLIIVELVLIIPLGILSIILGIMILKLNTQEARNLKSFAILSIIIGIALFSVVLILIIPLLSIVSDVILARVFFKAYNTINEPDIYEFEHELLLESDSKAPLEPIITALNPAARQISAWLASPVFIVLSLSLLLDIYQLFNLYELYDLQFSGHDKKILFSLALLNLIKVTVLILLLKSRKIPEDLTYWLKFLLLIYVIAISLSVYFFYAPRQLSLVSWLSMDYWLLHGIGFIINFLLAFIYFRIAIVIANSQLVLNGFKKALTMGLYCYALFLALYFFDTLKLSSQLYINFVLLSLFVSYYFSGLKINLSTNKNIERVFISVLLFGPVIVFCASFLIKSAGFLAENSDWIAQTSSDFMEITEKTEMTEISSIPDPLNQFKKVTSKPVFNNAWLFSDTQWLAINKTHLYKTEDAGKHWALIKKLAYDSEEIHFDASGKRGWVGDRLNVMEITEDGGQSWRTIEPVKIYSEVLGKKYRESMLNNWSYIHLDPDTGKGSFTLKCDYFYTEDFAQSWKNFTIRDKEGDEICLYESAFSVNEDKTLAMTGRMLLYYLYRKKPGENYWEQVCNLEDGLFHSNPCASNKTLTEKEKKYSQHYKTDRDYFSKANIEDEELQQIISDSYYPVEQLSGTVQQSGNLYWYADSHRIILTKDRGEHWQTIQDLKEFSFIIPVDQDHAYAWQKETGLYYTSDMAQSWQALFPDTNKATFDSIYSDTSKKLWELSSSKLISIDVLSGELSEHLNLQKENYDTIGSSENGNSLWLYQPGYQKAKISFDLGKNWFDFNTYSIMKDRNKHWTFLSIHQIICNEQDTSCLITLSDSSVIKVKLNNNTLIIDPDERFVLPETSDDYDYQYNKPGWLSINYQDNTMLYLLPEEANYIYLSHDRGSIWNKVAVKARRYWEKPDYRNNGQSIMAYADDAAIISHDSGQSWLTINPGEDDSLSTTQFCWGQDGRTLIMSQSEKLSITLDGGTNWQSIEQDYPVQSGCAIA